MRRPATASEITIAAASDLKFALREIVSNFQAAHLRGRIEKIDTTESVLASSR
jgi:molybdate transport system substrate-binding protein